MKYARKMVLIPEEEYQTLMNSKSNQSQRAIKDVLNEPRDHEAASKMSQLVGTYLRRKQSETLPTPTKDDVLDYFNPIYQRKVVLFLSKLHDLGMEWNTDKEVKLPSGEIISHSNIVDLIKEALVSGKRKTERRPLGWEDFIRVIASSNIPKSMFTKKSTLEEIERVSQHGDWIEY